MSVIGEDWEDMTWESAKSIHEVILSLEEKNTDGNLDEEIRRLKLQFPILTGFRYVHFKKQMEG